MKHSIHYRNGLPLEFQTLLDDYPRAAWPKHPHFAQAIQHWLDAHRYFKRVGALLNKETQLFLDKNRSATEFTGRFGHYGSQLIKHLHAHHHWEDHEYFPELSAADNRFDAGLDMLETDHIEMDKLLGDFANTATRALKLSQFDPKLVYEEAGKLLITTQSIQTFLDRHLTDEEDLIVPILLHHKMRG